jgi:hypothetical protein
MGSQQRAAKSENQQYVWRRSKIMKTGAGSLSHR